ncbi:hypothetical protein GGR54DRAFT_639443 [Hypoxylon sp. NC1633]|nr:hypothetical protein GGR54DRAFT_639443 [Hypoxylon sp. NC1633]
MKAIIYLLAGVLVAGVKATDSQTDLLATPSDVLLNGYTFVPFSMEGAIESGGEVMIFNGTVTSIFDQIRSLKPDFEWDDFQPTTPLPAEHHNVKRDKSPNIKCNIPGYTVGGRFGILDGHDFLIKIKQPCTIAGGPRTCALLFCRDGDSVWMCNDNKYPITRGCDNIASYVLDIIGEVNCLSQDFYRYPPNRLMQGQEFDSDNFNVVVGGSGCL